MNRDEFNRLYTCNITPSARDIDIDEKLRRYYESAEKAGSNHEVSRLWFEFVKWCKDCGYSNSEINLAKRRLSK